MSTYHCKSRDPPENPRWRQINTSGAGVGFPRDTITLRVDIDKTICKKKEENDSLYSTLLGSISLLFIRKVFPFLLPLDFH